MPPVADLHSAWQPKGQAPTASKPRGPVAIVDIGSNSVRLVIYESQSRVAATLQNEKSICAIGRDMVTSGRLHAEGCTAALEALSRFRMIADGLNVEARDAVMDRYPEVPLEDVIDRTLQHLVGELWAFRGQASRNDVP